MLYLYDLILDVLMLLLSKALRSVLLIYRIKLIKVPSIGYSSFPFPSTSLPSLTFHADIHLLHGRKIIPDQISITEKVNGIAIAQ